MVILMVVREFQIKSNRWSILIRFGDTFQLINLWENDYNRFFQVILWPTIFINKFKNSADLLSDKRALPFVVFQQTVNKNQACWSMWVMPEWFWSFRLNRVPKFETLLRRVNPSRRNKKWKFSKSRWSKKSLQWPDYSLRNKLMMLEVELSGIFFRCKCKCLAINFQDCWENLQEIWHMTSLRRISPNFP